MADTALVTDAAAKSCDAWVQASPFQIPVVASYAMRYPVIGAGGRKLNAIALGRPRGELPRMSRSR